MLIVDIVRKLQFVEIDRIVHPVITCRGTVEVYVRPTFEGMLRICRSRVAPAAHITPVLILVSAIFVPMIGGRYYLQDNIIILTLLQTTYV